MIIRGSHLPRSSDSGSRSAILRSGSVCSSRSSVMAIAKEMARYDRAALAETKRLSNQVLNQDLDGAMRVQEWLFRTYIGSEDNHQRIDALQAQLAAARKK